MVKTSSALIAERLKVRSAAKRMFAVLTMDSASFYGMKKLHEKKLKSKKVIPIFLLVQTL